MPEKQKRLKSIAIFALFALPAVLFIAVAWVISVYTPFLKSLGQVMIILILSLGFLALSGYLYLTYITKKFIKPAGVIDYILSNFRSKGIGPLPTGTNLEGFEHFYQMLFELQTSFNQENQTINRSNQIISAQDKLFEISISEISDPLIILNGKMEVRALNLAAQNFTGINRLDVIGKRIDQFVRLYDKNNTEIPPSKYCTAKLVNETPKVFSGSEIKIISSINVQSYADVSVFKPDMGALIDVYSVMLFHDKSREKQLEAMKLDFVSMAAHELRTPLTSVKGYISVFLSENEKKLNPEQLMFIRRINTSTQQLSGLVENLLSVARVERGALSLNHQIVDWVNNVKSQFDTFQHRADEKRISLKFTAPDKPISKVSVDIVRVNEVLNNLISNAINYTEPMGKIEIWIDQKDEMVYTHVKDTGKGIPKEAIEHLFTKFFRVQGGSAEQASKGNGLGLYLSKAIVELHHGKIWAESEGSGKGSTFSFGLPAVKENIDIGTLTKSM